MPAIGEGGNTLGDIAAAADFQHVAPKRVGGFFGYNDGGFWLVLRPRRTATGPAAAAAAGLGGFVATGVLVVGFAPVVAAIIIFGVLGVKVCVAIAAISWGGVGVGIGVIHEFLLSSRPETIEPAMVIFRVSELK